MSPASCRRAWRHRRATEILLAPGGRVSSSTSPGPPTGPTARTRRRLPPTLEKHATKGRLVYVAGKLQTRSWRNDGEASDRRATEILLAPGGRVQFLDKPRTANGSNGSDAPAASAQATEAPAASQDDLDDDIPF